MWTWTPIEQSLQELRHALRTLLRTPVFALTAVATLALGIGANSAVFQVPDAVFLQRLPIRNASELAMLKIKGGNFSFGITDGPDHLTFPLFEAIRGSQKGFDDIIAWDTDGLVTGIAPATRQVHAVYASGGYFGALDLSPAAGRLLAPADDLPWCKAPGVVLSHAFWQSVYGGQSSAIGRRLVVQGRPLEILGVAPARFRGLDIGDQFDIVLPLCARALLDNACWPASPASSEWSPS